MNDKTANESQHEAMAAPGPSPARQGLGFVVSGLIALSVDMGVTSVLARVAGLSPYLARPLGIALAMLVGWLCHRRLTFDVKEPATFDEFARYAAVAWGVAALNYAVYAGELAVVPTLPPEAALVVSSLVAMAASFLGMKLGVFRRS